MKKIKELTWLEKTEDYRKLSDINGRENIVFAKPDRAKKEINRGKYLLNHIRR